MIRNLVRADDLGVVLGGRPVLEAISFTVCAGELVGVIGPNGAGKTTLLRVILGLVSLRRGSLTVLGASGDDLREVRPRIGYMPQRQSFERRFPLSAADVVFTGLLAPQTILRRVSSRVTLVREALRSVGMEHFYRRPFQSLSGGEQQRVLLARALVGRPRLLLLDEPGAGLDFPAQHDFLALLEKLKGEEDLGILLVSHDLVSVATAADRLICINRTMHLHGRPAEVLHSPHLDQAYRCQFDFLSALGEETGCSN